VLISCQLSGWAELPLPSLPKLPFVGEPKPAAKPAESPPQPVLVFADHALRWDEDGMTVLLARGRCRIAQGDESLHAQQMVLWLSQVQQPDGRVEDRVLVYSEEVRIDRPTGPVHLPSTVSELVTRGGTQLIGRPPVDSPPAHHDHLYQRAAEQTQHRRPAAIVQTAHAPLAELPSGEMGLAQGPSLQLPGGAVVPRRHVSIVPRDFEVPFVAKSRVSEATVPPELIVWITRGVNVVVEGVPVTIDGIVQSGTIDLTADNAVIWTDATRLRDLSLGAELDPDTPFQVYLEGNIVVRQGTSVARASHAFYDIRQERGLLYNVELRTFIPELEGDLRLRADRVRQLSRDNYHAQNAWVSGSQFGRPGYRLEAADIFLERRPGNPYPWTIDPGDSGDLSSMWVTSLDNRFLLGEVPIFRTPYLSAPAEDPQIPLRRASFDQDRVFGTQIRTAWNVESIFGLNLPPNTDWDLLLDYLSDRGPAIGSEAAYEGTTSLFAVPVRYDGVADLYYINDRGSDNLGLGRRSLPTEDDNRGQALWRNRLRTPDGSWIRSELGYISDRNFLEQYYENDWDEGKDHETLLEIGQQRDNRTATGLLRRRLNDFENTTDWLRGDLTLLAEPLLGDWLTWSTHTSVGYGHIQPADLPFNPLVDVFTPLPFLADAEGLVAMTRHELALPLPIGPLQIVPYVLGEGAYWQEDLTGDDLSRLYGSAGVRASILFWRVMPWVHSRVFGLNGLAHKMVFDVDWSVSEASEDLAGIAQFNEFDDDAQERFRSRFFTLEFGGVLPPTFDPRRYAVRTGAGRSVTAPYHELVDDLQVVRLGWRHHLQTKVGPPDRLRIKDWMTLDLDVSYFPEEDRDNFGEEFGLFSTRYAWHVGERTTLMANSLLDFFDTEQQIWNLGILSQRSARGSVYLGFRQVKGGPIDSQIVTASYSYAMSPKWVSSLGTAYDLAEGRDRGQSLVISRIGGDWVVHFGLSYDRSKNNAGIGLSIEPRLGHLRNSQTQLSSLLGIR
jgi:hypothetical protein